MSKLAQLFAKRAQKQAEQRAAKVAKASSDAEQALLAFAYPLGAYFGDELELDSAREFFEVLAEENLVPENVLNYLRHNREFCRLMNQGINDGFDWDEEEEETENYSSTYEEPFYDDDDGYEYDEDEEYDYDLDEEETDTPSYPLNI